MVGITRIGTYFPRRRLDRALIAKAWGTRVPAGTRTVAGLDEDALTMATDAVLGCVTDDAPTDIDALYFASTSSAASAVEAISTSIASACGRPLV